MPFVSNFAKRRTVKAPPSSGGQAAVHTDLRGLDLTSPYDAIQKNRSPGAKNFRMYAQEAGDRRVAISSRKGSGRYLDALSEAVDQQQLTVTGAANQLLGISNNWIAMKYVAGATGPMTRIDLNLKSNLASGPIIVEFWSNNAGVPGIKLATSGILNSAISSTYGYIPARFVEAPAVVSGTTYWIIAYMQDDGIGNYHWSSTTVGTLALTSATQGLSWVAASFSMNYKAYVSSTATTKGLTRFTPDTSANTTMVAIGTNMYTGNDGTGALTSIASGLSSSATDYFFTEADGKKFWVNGFDALKTWDGATVASIAHTNLPTLRLATFHLNRLFGIDAALPNRLVFSEVPGNDDGAGNLWYDAWLSTSFIYVPHPKAQDPVTAIVPFQNNLYIFTRTGKWTLFGSDPGSFDLRESTGHKGAVHQNAVYADENYIYFVAPDGLYRFNGSSDELISDMNGVYGVQPEFDNIANLDQVFVTKWKRQIRFYYPTSGSAYNNSCLSFHTTFVEWLKDTDTYVSRAIPWTDGSDPDDMMEASSTSTMVTKAEVDFSNYGKHIDFEYDCNYDSFGNPAMRKRIQKFYPLLEGEHHDYFCQVGIDKDREDTPSYTNFPLLASGAKIGAFKIGDGTEVGISNQFVPAKVRAPGFAYYWQVRIKRKGINTPVRFIGYVMTYKGKRL